MLNHNFDNLSSIIFHFVERIVCVYYGALINCSHMVCCRVDEMIRNVESFEGKTHIHQVTILKYNVGSKMFLTLYLYLLCNFSECRDCHAGSSRWHFKNIFGHFCVSNFMGKRVERWKRKYFRNNQNEGECFNNERYL